MDIKAELRAKNSELRNKRILITAGPTWVPIDNVRVISNIASGETGILLAEKLNKLGAKVTLFLGPVGGCRLAQEIKIIRFKFFGELRDKLKKELSSKSYSLIIHSAAVSDFRPAKLIKGKLRSNKSYNLKLAALPKIINDIKSFAPRAKLISFKLESGVSDAELISRAREDLAEKGQDLIVANKIGPRYKAYILDRKTIYSRIHSKKELAKKLTAIIGKKYFYGIRAA